MAKVKTRYERNRRGIAGSTAVTEEPEFERRRKMATIEELIKQYETDPELKAEVEKILEDQKITIGEFMGFVKKHDVEISLSDFSKVIQEAKEAGLIK